MSEKKGGPLLKITRPTFKPLNAKVETGTHGDVEKYMKFVEDETGVKVTLDETVNGMLAGFMQSDKAFQKRLKGGRGAGTKPATSATPAGGGAGG